jgi:adenosine deaminase
MSDFLLDLFRAMPKVELHMHLDGALTVKTAIELLTKGGEAADRAGDASGASALPAELKGGAFAPLSYEALYRRLVIGGPLSARSTQAELLAYYDLPIALLQSEEALARVTDELLRAKAADRVRYCEIRWAPALHCNEGLSVRQVAASVARATRTACARHDIRARLIVVGMRFHAPEANVAMLREATLADADGLIAAADLAGPEAAHPDPTAQKPFFEEARRLGLGLTLHCGELPGSADAIRRCAELIAPDRIAHGSGAADDEGLCRLLAERNIGLDLCPTSNIQAGLYADHADFPVAMLHERGVPVSISTDSPVISGRTLSEEYRLTALAGRLSPAELWQINLSSVDRIFADESVKRALREEFRAWARGVAELGRE